MVPSLRTRHRQIWMLLLVLLPILFVLAMLVLPKPVPSGKMFQQQEDLPANFVPEEKEVEAQ